MGKLVLTVGVPASGKSTLGRQYVDRGFVQIERDLLRMKHYGVWYGGSIDENKITRYQIEEIRRAVLDGRDVIVSDTNISKDTRDHLANFGRAIGCDVEIIHINPELLLPELIERNANREDKSKVVPVGVMNQMYVRYREQFPLKAPAKSPLKLNAFVFDIDGTLADMAGVRGPFDWKKVGKDRPHDDVCDMTRLLAKDHKIIMVSGRDGVCRDETYGWLVRHGVAFDALYMRPEGSQLKDSAIKHDIYHHYIAPYYNVLGVFDDRDQVVATWRSMGLRCYQVDYGNF